MTKKQNTYYFVSVILLLFTFLSCKNKFDTNAPWHDITVVYAIINTDDSVHYVRVYKGYTGYSNALTSAQNPDSIYYTAANVKLEVLKNNTIDKVLNFSETTDLIQDTGVFANKPNRLFYANGNLSKEASYKLTVTIPQLNKTVWAETFAILNIASFWPNTNSSGKPIFSYNRNEYIRWQAPINAKLFELKIRFNYREVINNDTTNTYIDWTQTPVNCVHPNANEEVIVTLKPNSFYYYLSNNIAVKPGVTRLAGKVDYLFTIADTNFSNYLERYNLVNSYNDIPPYSNINNGMGLLALRIKQVFANYELCKESIDSLCFGQFTSKLNFKKF